MFARANISRKKHNDPNTRSTLEMENPPGFVLVGWAK
jgi:hypothetical protein